MSETVSNNAPRQTGYVTVSDLEMPYEIHGKGDTPLLLRHEGRFEIHLAVRDVLPGLPKAAAG